MSMYEQQIQVLAILSRNLSNPQPQLVSTTTIADELGIQPTALHLVLNTMNAMDLIKTNSDLQYNLITSKGLEYLDGQQVSVSNRS